MKLLLKLLLVFLASLNFSSCLEGELMDGSIRLGDYYYSDGNPTELPDTSSYGADMIAAMVHFKDSVRLMAPRGVSFSAGYSSDGGWSCLGFRSTQYKETGMVFVSANWCEGNIDRTTDQRLWLRYYPDSITNISYHVNTKYDSWRTEIDYKTIPSYPVDLDIIRFDTAEKVFAGTFEALLVRETPPFDTIYLKDGRFDAGYYITNPF